MDETNYYSAISLESELPIDLFEKKVAVIMTFENTNNARVLINSKGDKSYNCLKMVDHVKSYCKDAGLKVERYIVDEYSADLSGKYKYSVENEVKDLSEFKSAGIDYFLVVSIGKAYPKNTYSKENASWFPVIAYELGSEVFYGTKLEKLSQSKHANSSNYLDAEVEYRISKDASFNRLDMKPSDFKGKEIYFVKYPTLKLPTSQPKGLGCKMMAKSNSLLAEKHMKNNQYAKEILGSSGLNVKIVDSRADLPLGEDVYVLVHYQYKEVEYNLGPGSSGTGYDSDSKEYFMLINLKTYEIYLFNEGHIKFDTYLKSIVKKMTE